MYNIGLNKVITLVRGDTFSYDYELNLGAIIYRFPYKMKEGDYLYFAICEPNQPFEEAVVKKRYDYTSCEEREITNQFDETETYYFVDIKLSSEDTVNLTEGKYYYTIKLLIKKDGEDYDVITTQPKTLFYLV